MPVLTGLSLDAPITDSSDISRWLCAQQPKLKPAEHTATIDMLVKKIYAFHAMALTIPAEERKFGVPNQAAEKLEKENLSDGHRRALEIKSIL